LQKPDHAIFEHHPTINSELLHYIKLGRIVPHPDIAKIEDDTVHFIDGTSERFDMIVYATGYNLGSFSFFSPPPLLCSSVSRLEVLTRCDWWRANQRSPWWTKRWCHTGTVCPSSSAA
jgi:hypothetical protein